MKSPASDGNSISHWPNRCKRFLTRSGFPPGAPGLLFVQAGILMAGLERMPFENSVSGLDGIDLEDDGALVVPDPTEKKIREDPQYPEYTLKQRMGSTMTAAMMGAFACELAMKAISLTIADEARKAHDLLSLFNGLPEASTKRVEADFGDIRRVMEESRYLFDKWRYFDSSIGGDTIKAMIDRKRSFRLGKAARVLLDSASALAQVAPEHLGQKIVLHRQPTDLGGDGRTYLREQGARLPTRRSVWTEGMVRSTWSGPCGLS